MRQAAQEAYRVCAETRHVSLGEKARDTILAMQSQDSVGLGKDNNGGRCPDCDDTGDVHRIDGEWLGTCHCPAGKGVSGDAAELAAFGASEHACALYPGEDQAAERAAFIAGATHQAKPAVDAVPAGEVDTYSRWLAGDETLPTLPREQYLRFQASSDRAIKNRRRTPQTVADGVEEVRRNPDDPDWDNCPACKGGALDTGYECNTCGFDAQPLVHLKDACEARGERMHPSGLYESEIAHPFLAALSHGEGRK
ncbi:hypothetical protein [Sphingomonas yabuuchiae]|uniref:hypothetical protein n=1 Tax=Sphingomonas yabuuchiae TaxID=172044 RepID=UPI00360A0B99